MSPRRNAILYAYLAPLLVGLAVYVPAIWDATWNRDSCIYTAISLKAAREGHWLPLHNANIPFLNKPPLWYWVHAAFASVLGESDWSLRAPEVLAALGCIAVLVSLVLRLHGPRVAMLAGILLATCSECARLAREVRLDMVHTLFMLLAVRLVVAGCLPRVHRGATLPPGHTRPWLIAAAGVPVGLALMVKPIFGLIALLIAAIWLAMAGPKERMRPLIKWVGVAAAVSIAVATPWHIAMWRVGGDTFITTYFKQQALERATGDRFDGTPWFGYGLYLSGLDSNIGPSMGDPSMSKWMLPFIGLCMLGIGWWVLAAIRGKQGRRLAPRVYGAGGLLVQIWLLVFLIALSAFADKRARYLMPVFPAMAWVGALWLARICPRGIRSAIPRAVAATGAAGIVMVVAPVIARTAPPTSSRAIPPRGEPVEQYIKAHPTEDYWNGSLATQDSARLYISTGIWPKYGRDPNAQRSFEIPVGATLLYDRTRFDPEPTDQIIMDNGRFVIARRTRADAAEPPAKPFW